MWDLGFLWGKILENEREGGGGRMWVLGLLWLIGGVDGEGTGRLVD